MKLSRILQDHFSITSTQDCEIKGLAIDSRQVKSGYLFFAYEGTHHDGSEYIQDAIEKGAVAVLTDSTQKNDKNIPIINVPQLRKKIPDIAAQFYQYPAKSLRIVGVTGTNGKTSCTHFLASSLQQLEISCGVIGTLGNGLYGQTQETNLTTPDAITLQKTFSGFLREGAKAVAMEVSSHSLDQGRIAGIEFEVGVFTNLTRDHLDYHGSMEAYGKAKRKLFDCSRNAVINLDDAFGRTLIQSLPKETIFSYSTHDKDATVFANNIDLSISGIKAEIFSPWGQGDLKVPLIGKFNLSNLLAVLTTLCVMNIPFKKALECLSHLSSVPGRMQILGGGKAPLVVVDYSHTPDALEKVLVALRQHCLGKLYCLFGCGGDRDRGKRPVMAKIAETHSDFILVTDDNPRTEDPRQIVTDILKGFVEIDKVQVQHNRSKAIEDIIKYAKEGDCVLIAGKGAETYQQIGNDKIPFSDVEQVEKILNKS